MGLRLAGAARWIAIPLIVSGCVHIDDDSHSVLAVIGNEPVTQSDFERYVRVGGTPAGMDEILTNPSVHDATLEAFFDLELLAAKARREGIDQETNFRKACELMEMKLLVQAITERDRALLMELAKDPTGAGKRDYMERVNTEVGMKPTVLATNDSPLIFTNVIEQTAVLATLGDTPILESDFQWFLKDAFRPEQRPYVFSRPGAREELLNGYLSMRALEARARQDGLDRETAFIDARSVSEDKLLAEFLLERDRMMPWQLGNDQEGREALRRYLDQLRSELDFHAVSPRSVSE